MLSYWFPQICTSHSDHGLLLCQASRKMSFQCLLYTVLRSIYAVKKVWVLFTCRSLDLTLNRRKIIGAVWVYFKYMCMFRMHFWQGKALQFRVVFCNEFTWRHCYKHAVSSCGSKRKRNFLACTGNVNIPELCTIARCTYEQSHEKLHSVYWTQSASLRNWFWPKEITILMHRMHGRLISRISNKILFCLSPHVIFQKKRSAL